LSVNTHLLSNSKIGEVASTAVVTLLEGESSLLDRRQRYRNLFA
jgi:hypothetical protein